VKRNVLKRHLLASVGAVGLASATAATSATAGDFPGPAPAAAPWSWTGFYIGAHAGYGWGRDPFSDEIFGSKIPPLSGIHSKGFLGGFQAGANVQHGPWVGGLEIDLSGTNIKGSTSSAGGPTEIAEEVTSTLRISQTDKFDWIGSARARFGYLPWPNLLLYGTGGLAWTRFSQTQTADFTITQSGTTVTANQSITTPTWRFGWVAGAGVETRLWDSNWLARVEYLHFDFRDSGYSISTEPGFSSTSGHLTADVVRAGLSYKFGLGPWAGTASAAYAADMPLKAPRVAGAPWSWSGFYIGGHVGYGWGRDPFNEVGSSPALSGVNSNGVVGGLQAGINRQSGAWVGGLEIDLSASDIKGSSSSAASGVGFNNTRTQTDSFEMLGSARARLGYLVSPSVLVYGTGGLAWTRFVEKEVDGFDSGGSIGTNTSSNPSWRFGWIAGAGVEARLWDTNWLGRIEYLHYDFGQAQPTSFGSSASDTSGRLTTDVIRAGVSYKLDWLAGPDGPAKTVAMPTKAPPANVWDWSGYYLGAHVGYGWGHDPRQDEFFGGKVPTSPVLTDINSKGWVAGFQGGHNWQVRNWVGGLEIDLSASGIKGSETSVLTDGVDTAIEKDTDKFKLLGSARARLGYLVLPNVLLYGTGGLGWTELVQQTDFSFNGSLSGGAGASWHFGWVAGAGVETRLGNSNWLWRLEYLHYDFGDTGSNSFSAVSTDPDPAMNGGAKFTSGRLTIDAVRTGLSYKFN
jgi:outer membrane immunogenic protein